MSEVNVQILKDTTDSLVVKWVNVNSAQQETNAEKVNSAALFATNFNLNTDGNSAISLHESGFIPGETVVGNTSGVTAKVVAWNYGTNALAVVRIVAAGGNTAFANGELITGRLSGSNFIVANTASPGRALDIESLWFAVSDAGRVNIEWEGLNGANAAYVTAASLYGQGYFGKNALAALFSPPAANSTWTANGSISVTTVGLTANGGYTIVAEFRKGNGFSSVPDAQV